MSVVGAPAISGYTIDAEIGRGGFGIVYAAHQAAVGAQVAIKVIGAIDGDADAVRRFQRESLAMGALRGHPHIVRILDAGMASDGRAYLVMELLEGGSLHGELVRRGRDGHGPFGATEVLDIGVKLASAVAAAHEQGILHRDLKPGNVLRSSYGEPQLTDFGVARLADMEASVSGSVLSAGFTAPEIIEGGQPTQVSDVFSLGCTLHTLASGRSPFRRPEDAGVLPALSRTVTDPVPDLRPLGVPDVVCAVLERAMEKDPEQRWQSAAVMARALQQAQGSLGLPVTDVPLPDGAPAAVPALPPPTPPGAPPSAMGDPGMVSSTEPPSPRELAAAVAANPRRGPLALVLAVTIVVLLAGSWALLTRAGSKTLGATVERVEVDVADGVFEAHEAALEIAVLYERWATSIHLGHPEWAYELYGEPFTAEVDEGQFAIEWTGQALSDVLLEEIAEGDDGDLITVISFNSTLQLRDTAEEACVVVALSHDLEFDDGDGWVLVQEHDEDTSGETC